MLSAADQIPAVPGKPVAAAAAAARHNNNNANNGQAGGSSSRSSELSRVAAKRGVFYRAFRKDFVGVVGSESTWFKKHTAATGNDCERIIPFTRINQQPDTVANGQMKEYQLTGLSFMVWLFQNGMSGILGDEMGLGKTLQTLSFFTYLKHNLNNPGPYLVICPLSVLGSWMNEAKKWTPQLSVFQFHGDASNRAFLKEKLLHKETKPDIIVTTFEQFLSEQHYFKHRFNYQAVVIDEGHKIKNEKTQLALALFGLNTRFKMLLTGTPLQNNLKELWALLHWLYPDMFDEKTSQRFNAAFDLAKGVADKSFMESARTLLSRIMLRRTKDEVELSILPKEELTIFLPISYVQRFWYKRLMLRLDKMTLKEVFVDGGAEDTDAAAVATPATATANDVVDSTNMTVGERAAADIETRVATEVDEMKNMVKWTMEHSNTASAATASDVASKPSVMDRSHAWQKLMMLWIQLRKVCDHPYMFPGSEPEPYENGQHMVYASSKMLFLDKLLPHLLANGHKALIFSNFTSMLDILEDYLIMRGYRYARLDGSTGRARRNLQMKMFNKPESETFIFLLSTRAGGLGINLTAADTVIFYDSDLNPQVDIQAMARAHRIGQKKIVKVYRLVIKDTVEEHQHRRSQHKLFLDAQVIGHHTSSFDTAIENFIPEDANEESVDEADNEMKKLSRTELVKMFRFGANAILKMGDSFENFLRAPVQEILEKASAPPAEETVEEGRGTDDSAATAGSSSSVLSSSHNVTLETNAGYTEMEDKSSASISSLLFEGKNHMKQRKSTGSYRDIASEWKEMSKRTGKDRVVIIDGMPVLKESIGNGEAWTAIPTFTGSASAVAERENGGGAGVKRKRRLIHNQDFCMICGGEEDKLLMCGRCPRTTCVPCSGIKKNVADKLKGVLCAQHNCFDCQRATTAAGGMLYRCRTCEKAFCEDCLGEREQDARVSSGDVTKEVDYIGYTLPEMDDLDYGEQSTHFWIRCFDCINQGKCFVYTPPDPAVKEAAAAAAAAAAVLPKTKKSRSGEPLEKKQAVAPRPAPKAREAVPKDVLKKSRKPRTPKVVAPPQASDSNAAVVGDVADGFVAVGAPVDLLAATEPAMAFSYVSGSGDVIHHQQQQEQQDLESSSLSAVGSTSSLSLVEDAQQVFVDDSFAVSSDDLSSVSINSTES